VRFVHFLRLITLLVTLAYCCGSLPISWVYWLEEHFSSASAIYDTDTSRLTLAGEFGVYITAPVAMLIVFVAVPRFRWGVRALSWCFLLLGICVLTNLYHGYSNRYLSAVVQIKSYCQELSFSLAPTIIGILLRHRFVARELRAPRSDEGNVSS
jgi:hypothetical protein